MSESRRANAAYQPEIDEMIFDYLLYYAIKSQLELSNLEHLDDENSLEDEDYQLDVRLTAERLLTAFNGFAQIFNINHPLYAFASLQKFNLKLLEFLLLFVNVSQNRRQRQTVQLSIDTLTSLHRAHSSHLKRRRSWLALRHLAAVDVPSSLAQYEEVDLHFWESVDAAESDSRLGHLLNSTGTKASIQSILPVFLTLSAAAVDLCGKPVSETWMRLAVEFMLQGAVEQLSRCFGDAAPNADIHVRQSYGDNPPGRSRNARDVIEANFAYGYLPPVQQKRKPRGTTATRHSKPSAASTRQPPNSSAREPYAGEAGHDETSEDDVDVEMQDITDESPETRPAPPELPHDQTLFLQDETEIQLQDLFSTESPVGESSPAPSQSPAASTANPKLHELPAWTQIRRAGLSLFELGASPPSTSQDATPPPTTTEEGHAAAAAVVRDLKAQHPLAEFERDVLRFAESLWHLIGNANPRGLPTLVKIERRDYRGLGLGDEEEFRRVVGRAAAGVVL